MRRYRTQSNLTRSIRVTLFSLLMLLSSLAWVDAAYALPRKGNTLRVAVVAEPKSLDPLVETTHVVTIITQHVFETLYSLGENDKVVPLLASELPDLSEDRMTVRIKLREEVQFHDGSVMTANDVVASLQRWLRLSVRGKNIADKVISISADGHYAVVLRLTQPINQLPNLLALFSSAAVIMPAHKLADVLTEFIGTGPYKFNKRVQGEYILLSRNTLYKSHQSQSKGHSNKRTAYLDALRFIPVPKAEERLDGLRQGTLDYADELPPAYLSILEKADTQIRTEILESLSDTMLYFNTRQGIFKDRAMRYAVQSVINPKTLLQIGFGAQTQYSKTKASYPAARTLPIYEPSGSLYPARYPWHTSVGTENYAKPDLAKAKEYAQAAQYDGRTLRLLTSTQYYFHLRFALEAARQLTEAGFPTDLQIVDWPTLIEIRKHPEAWDMFFTHGPFPDSPTLSLYFNGAAAGWWQNPEKENIISAFNRESNMKKRIALFHQLQAVLYADMPVIKLGNFSKIAATTRKLHGFKAAILPHFWNAWIDDSTL